MYRQRYEFGKIKNHGRNKYQKTHLTAPAKKGDLAETAKRAAQYVEAVRKAREEMKK